MEYAISTLKEHVKSLEKELENTKISTIDYCMIMYAISSCNESIANLETLCEGNPADLKNANCDIFGVRKCKLNNYPILVQLLGFLAIGYMGMDILLMFF